MQTDKNVDFYFNQNTLTIHNNETISPETEVDSREQALKAWIKILQTRYEGLDIPIFNNAKIKANADILQTLKDETEKLRAQKTTEEAAIDGLVNSVKDKTLEVETLGERATSLAKANSVLDAEITTKTQDLTKLESEFTQNQATVEEKKQLKKDIEDLKSQKETTEKFIEDVKKLLAMKDL